MFLLPPSSAREVTNRAMFKYFTRCWPRKRTVKSSYNDVSLPYFTFWHWLRRAKILKGFCCGTKDFDAFVYFVFFTWYPRCFIHKILIDLILSLYSLFECNVDHLYAKHHFLLNCTAMITIAWLKILLITQKKSILFKKLLKSVFE